MKGKALMKQKHRQTYDLPGYRKNVIMLSEDILPRIIQTFMIV